MHTLKELLTGDHRQCDIYFTNTEQAVAKQAWDRANAAFAQFQQAMLAHFTAEETLLFPAFEAKTGMSMGPTEVMRGEHIQMRQLMEAARQALQARDADDYDGQAETLLIMMQQHNVKEENVLYPMCDQHLSDQYERLLPQLQEKIAPA